MHIFVICHTKNRYERHYLFVRWIQSWNTKEKNGQKRQVIFIGFMRHDKNDPKQDFLGFVVLFNVSFNWYLYQTDHDCFKIRKQEENPPRTPLPSFLLSIIKSRIFVERDRSKELDTRSHEHLAIWVLIW